MKNLLTLLILCCTFSGFAQNYKFGKVSKEELEESVHPLDSTAEAAYLYSKRRTSYNFTKNEGFQIVNEIHQRIKIYSKEGFDKATQEISFYKPESGSKERVTGISAVTYNLEGGKIKKTKVSKKQIFEEKLSKYFSQKKITFPEIKEGTVLELEYKLVSPYSTVIDDLEFQQDVPVKKMDCSIEIPEYFNFKQQVKGYYLVSPQRSTGKRSASWTTRERSDRVTNANSNFSNNKVEYNVNIQKYQAENIPALKDNEPFVYNINNYRGGIGYEINFVKYPNTAPKFLARSWDDVAKSIYKAIDPEIKRNNYYKADLNTALQGATDDAQKIGRLFQFVKEKVKWNGYSSVYPDVSLKKAYKEGTGNVAVINLMLISMLRSAGLDANPVLVSTRSHGVPLFPTRNGFNYVVASVSLPDGYVVMDASELYSLPNMLPSRAVNWQGRLILSNGSSRWLNLGSSTKSIEDNFVSVKIDDEGMVEGMMRTKYSNLGALEFRNRYNKIKEEELMTRMEDDFSVEVEEYKLANKFDIGKAVVRTVKFSSEDLVEGINGKLYVKPLLFKGYSANPFKLDQRQFPVEFSSPWKEKNTVTITIPEGYSIESAPEKKAIGLPENMGVFRYQVVPGGNKVKVISILELNQSTIPANYYEILKGFFGEVVEKQTEKIVLVKS